MPGQVATRLAPVPAPASEIPAKNAAPRSVAGGDSASSGVAEITKEAVMKWIHDGRPEQQHDMYFYASKKSTLLFKSWDIHSNTEFWLALIGIIALGVVYEMVKSFRSCLLVEAGANARLAENKPILDTGVDSRSCFEKFCVHSVLTIIYVVEMFIMFILMVIFMTYNIYFCLSVLLGVGLGYFFFGSGRAYGN